MPTATLTYWDYVKAAFKRRARVPLLGYVPFNYLALFLCGLAGIANAGFWFLGLALEIAYLGLLSSSGRFQKLVQGEALLKGQRVNEQRVQLAASALTPPSAERYQRLVEQCRQILGLSATGPSGVVEDMRGGSLSQLLWLFLRLLSSRELMVSTLAQVDKRALEADVSRIKERMAKAEPESALAKSLQATLDIQQKRIENLGKTKAGLDVVEAELDRIEQQVRLIREEAAVSGGPEILSSRLDAVSATLSETSKWMDQNAQFFSSLAGEEMDAPPPSLPSPVDGRAKLKQ